MHVLLELIFHLQKLTDGIKLEVKKSINYIFLKIKILVYLNIQKAHRQNS